MDFNVLMKTIILILSLLLAACGSSTMTNPPVYSGLVKTVSPVDGHESSIVNWKGELVFITSLRELDTSNTGNTTIKVYKNLVVVAEIKSRLAFISAIVHQDTVYIFGTVDNRTVQMVRSDDLIHWCDPIEVLDSAVKIYNTSVTADDNGFVMVTETDEGRPYTGRFYRSHDLLSWISTGGLFHLGDYAACPTIRYVNGIYYIFYLAIGNGIFYTAVDRSTDLVNFETSRYAVLSPSDGEGINTSDMDFAEVNGMIYFIYLIGDQSEWNELRLATFDGSTEKFVESLF